MKSPLAIARDEWLESEEGRRCLNGTAYGQFLRNRLVRGFLAGAKWAEDRKNPKRNKAK